MYFAKRFFLIPLIAALFSCDTQNPDVIPATNLNIEVATVPGGPAVINPSEIFGSSNFESVKFLNNPVKGTTGFFTDKNFIRYIPDTDFSEGDDSFALTFYDGIGNDFTATVNVRMRQAAECSDNGIFDYIKAKSGESFAIDLLDNDVFCGGPQDIRSGGVSNYDITVPEGSGWFGIFLISGSITQLDVDNREEGESKEALQRLLDNVGEISEGVYLLYEAPNDTFTGTIEFLYEVGINGTHPGVDLTDENGLIPSAFETYIVAQATIEISE